MQSTPPQLQYANRPRKVPYQPENAGSNPRGGKYGKSRANGGRKHPAILLLWCNALGAGVHLLEGHNEISDARYPWLTKYKELVPAAGKDPQIPGVEAL